MILLFAAMAIGHTAMAQNSPQTVLGAKIEVQEFAYETDSVKLHLEYDLEGLKIGTNQSVVFAPKIFKQENTLSLPTVVVKRRGGVKSYNRAMELGNAKSIELYDSLMGTPYQVIPFYGKERADRVSYSVTVPYESWMVESQLYIGCTTYGCCTTEDSGVLIPHENVLQIDIPSTDVYMVKPQVELVKPEKVAVKRREIQYSSALIFKVNSTIINPSLGNNREELASIDQMMQSVISDNDYTITRVNIIGFASPEGTWSNNMRLSEGRATALERLMMREYKMIEPALYRVKFGGENWGKLYELVEKCDIPYRDQALDIIKNTAVEDGRKAKLMGLNGGSTYRYLLKNIYPATRLVVVDVEYNIDAYDLERIAELIDTKPQNLSLEEMFRLSESHNIGDKEFEKIFLTAARIYPDDEVALNNALVTEIKRNNVAAVKDLVKRVNRETRSAELANSLGAYYMMTDDYEAAEQMFDRAIELGSSRAEYNRTQLAIKVENAASIKEAETLRKKIYGK